jgi:hypothetical protein
VEPDSDPLLRRKSGSAGNGTRDLCVCGRELLTTRPQRRSMLSQRNKIYFNCQVSPFVLHVETSGTLTQCATEVTITCCLNVLKVILMCVQIISIQFNLRYLCSELTATRPGTGGAEYIHWQLWDVDAYRPHRQGGKNQRATNIVSGNWQLKHTAKKH